MSEHSIDCAEAGDDPETRLAALWAEHSVRVQAFLLRRTDPDTAQDVLSETFLVAWRRLDDVPDPPLPWLLVVARNLVANADRAAQRRDALASTLTRLERSAPEPQDAPDELVTERDTLLRALGTLTDIEREAMLLVAWDGLDPAQAARVAGCSRGTFHVRLHRARRRMLVAAGSSSGSPTVARSGRTPESVSGRSA